MESAGNAIADEAEEACLKSGTDAEEKTILPVLIGVVTRKG